MFFIIYREETNAIQAQPLRHPNNMDSVPPKSLYSAAIPLIERDRFPRKTPAVSPRKRAHRSRRNAHRRRDVNGQKTHGAG